MPDSSPATLSDRPLPEATIEAMARADCGPSGPSDYTRGVARRMLRAALVEGGVRLKEIMDQEDERDIWDRAVQVGLRYKRERDEARERVRELELLVRRASSFVNAVAVMAEDKTPALAWIADAAKAFPRTLGKRDA